MTGRLLIRADAGPTIGMGHVIRCLALAQAWSRAGGAVTLAVSTALPEAVANQWKREGFAVLRIEAQASSAKDAAATLALAREGAADWLVVDGHHFTESFHQELRRGFRDVLCIDDLGGAAPSAASNILNQNRFADPGLYRGARANLLLGTSFALIRRSFSEARVREPRRIAKTASKILVTFGGSDPNGVARKVARALKRLERPGLEAAVIGGWANEGFAELEEALRGWRGKLHLERHSEKMETWMQWADIAVSAAGSTCLELAYLQTPMLLVAAVDNQRATAEAMARDEMAVSLGWHESVDEAELAKCISDLLSDEGTRRRLAERCSRIDGRGAERVVDFLQSRLVRVRPACGTDTKFLWELANDPVVRQASFSQALIPWADHVAWFEKCRSGGGHRLFLLEDAEGKPFGQINFERTGANDVTIGISLVPFRRNRGLGARCLRQALREVAAAFPGATVHAFIRPANHASARAFQAAGFSLRGSTSVKGMSALHWTSPVAQGPARLVAA